VHRAVILEHAPPDAEAHFDWMIEDPMASGGHRLRTWRTSSRPDGERRFAAEQIAHHRAAYLAFEGEIPPATPGGPARGVVRRLAEGAAIWRTAASDAVEFQIAWAGGPTLIYTGRRGADARWQFDALRA
jgi:hypothetical protein